MPAPRPSATLLLAATLLLTGCDALDARRARREAADHLSASRPADALPLARRAHDLAPGDARYLHTYTEAQRQLLRLLRHDLDQAPHAFARLHLAASALDDFEAVLDSDTAERLAHLRADARAESLIALDVALQDLDSALALQDAELATLASRFGGPERALIEARLDRLASLRAAAAALDRDDAPAAESRLASLPPDLPAALPLRERLAALDRRLDEALREAAALGLAGRHREAHELLAPLAARHAAWRPALAEASALALATGATHHASALRAALAARDIPAADAALAGLAYHRRTEFPFTAAELAEPASFAVFIFQLQSAGLAPAPGAARDTFLDLPLCAGLLDRFPDRAFAREHLAGGYLAWSRHLAAAGHIHLAGLAHDLAVAHGAEATERPAPPPATPRLALVLTPPVHPENQPATAFLASADAAARAALARRLAPLLRAEDTAPPDSTPALTARLELSRLDIAHKQSTRTLEARYLSGQRSVPNPAYALAQTAAQNALVAYNQAQAKAASVARQAGLNRSLASLGGNSLFGQLSNTVGDVATASSVGGVTPYQNAYTVAQQKLAATPPTIAEDVYTTHAYPEITHRLIATARAAIVLRSSSGREFRLPVGGELTHETTELRGDPARGGKVLAPVVPSATELETRLAAIWARELATREISLVDLAAQAAAASLRATRFPSEEARLEALLRDLIAPLSALHPALAAEFARAPDFTAFLGPLPSRSD